MTETGTDNTPADIERKQESPTPAVAPPPDEPLNRYQLRQEEARGGLTTEELDADIRATDETVDWEAYPNNEVEED